MDESNRAGRPSAAAPIRALHVVALYPTSERPHAQVFIKSQIDSLVDAGVACEVLTLRGRGPLKYATGWWQVRARRRGGRFDLIHAHYSYCAFVCLGQGLPLVTSFLGSDLAGRVQRDGSYSAFSRVSHRHLARFIAARSAACIVKSSRMRHGLGRDAHVVPNGVDLERFRPLAPERRAELRRSLGMEPQTRYLLFAADPALPHKRYALAEAAVAEAAARVSFPLRLLALTGRAPDDVARHMQAGDLLILTSSQEGSPNVVKEAMASGMAIVAVDIGDTRERLEGVSGCRVTANDRPETIGAAIVEVLLSDEPRDGRRAVEPLRREAIAARIVQIYRQVLGRD